MITATYLVSTKVRAQPTRAAETLTIAPAGTVAEVVQPLPVRADEHIWWKVKLPSGVMGYSAQATGGSDLLRLGLDKFDIAVSFTMFQEGGYQNNREDPGNWTGGEVGSGQLKGTKYGISAASYPTIDIVNLTESQAKNIYYRDYWLTVSAYLYDYPKYLILFDIGVVSGVGRARFLSELSALRIIHDQYLFYAASKRFNVFGAGWIRRNTALLGMIPE